ncbi:MAG: hypothetical protein HUK24_04200, partial [Sphaerochaetaceae bacterium]|nr:hypothetical protein [Sphaerochaetaceae bacterium]
MKPTLLVMAAGMGSRYGGIKQIDSVGANGETLLDYSVFDAFRNGFGKVVFIIRPDIEEPFRERVFDKIACNLDAQYVFQTRENLLTSDEIALSRNRTKPWGTIHALLSAKDVIKTPFAAINADDFYGQEAFSILGKYLSSIDNNSTDHAMVGYLLKNTMSKMGSVSRGVCQVDNDSYLITMRENTKIEYEGTSIVSHLPEGDVHLSGEEWVSMNFFGFSPVAFQYFEDFFNRFKKTSREDLK